MAKSPVEKYRACHRTPPSPSRRAFLKNHMTELGSIDFLTVSMVSLKVLFVLIVLVHERRKVVHLNVTDHPTAAWTLQKFREVLAAPHAHRFVLHDRDSGYSPWLEAAVTALGVRVLRTPIQVAGANAYCERLPEPRAGVPVAPIAGHWLPRDARVVARSVLGGLQHEYGIEKRAT